MIYTWEIIGFETKTITDANGVELNNAVCCVRFKRVCTTETGTVVNYLSRIDIPTTDILATNFVDFTDITSTIAEQWITNELNATEIEMMDEILVRKINETAISKLDPPWWL